MTLNLTIPPMTHTDFSPRITVIGVGGGGTNAVDNMIVANLQGVDFVVANTDAQQLMHSRADRRIQLGPHITQGLGAGAKPEIGKAAAEEASDELYRHLDGSHMVFITAGMGGGTGTGAAPVIARMAKERNILTVGVVTKPFGFEGARRGRAAEQGIEELQQYVDTLIVIPNQNLFRMANERTTWKDAFKMADQVLYMGVRGVTDLMMVHGLVNLDFADIRTVMAEMGKAMMGTGEAEGENRAIRAAEAAINNPLLEDTSMSGARGLLINITGGDDLTLFEVDEAANRIRQEVDEEANVIFGSAVDDTLSGRIRVSVVATGIDSQKPIEQARPKLVAMGGGGGAAPAPQPIVMRGVNTAPAVAPAAQAQPSAVISAFRQVSAAPQPVTQPQHAALAAHAESIVDPSVAHEETAEAASAQVHTMQPLAKPPMRAPQTPAQGFTPVATVPGRGGLFAEPPRAPAQQTLTPEPRPSLFTQMTGAFRRRTMGVAAPMQEPAHGGERVEPAAAEPSSMRAAVRQTSAAEETLEIPAFLRRQQSTH